MTSLNAIHLQVLAPVHSSSSSVNGSSSSTVISRDSHQPGEEDDFESDSDEDDHEHGHSREAMHDLESHGRYLSNSCDTMNVVAFTAQHVVVTCSSL